MDEPCRVPGCGGVRKDDRGYCEGHTWILPRRERTPAELIEELQETLAGHWCSAIPFLKETSKGDLELPAEWIGQAVGDPACAEEILMDLLGSEGQSTLSGLPMPLQALLEDDFRKTNTTELARLLAILRDGGELREFCSSPESWKHLCGRAGWAIVKDGTVLWTWVTVMT